jgi:hypothetical protein
LNDLYLSKELYSVQNIENAIKAFNNLARIKIKQDEKYYICTIQSSKYSVEETFSEFENYIIDLTNKGKL